MQAPALPGIQPSPPQSPCQSPKTVSAVSSPYCYSYCYCLRLSITKNCVCNFLTRLSLSLLLLLLLLLSRYQSTKTVVIVIVSSPDCGRLLAEKAALWILSASSQSQGACLHNNNDNNNENNNTRNRKLKSVETCRQRSAMQALHLPAHLSASMSWRY